MKSHYTAGAHWDVHTGRDLGVSHYPPTGDWQVPVKTAEAGDCFVHNTKDQT